MIWTINDQQSISIQNKDNVQRCLVNQFLCCFYNIVKCVQIILSIFKGHLNYVMFTISEAITKFLIEKWKILKEIYVL